MSIDEFVLHDGRIFDAALDGDTTLLRQAAGPDGVFCIDPEHHTALLVCTGPDGYQQGNVHLPGQVARLEIPRSFRVSAVECADGRFAVTGTDGEVIRGTARQFGRMPRLIDEPHNPAYQHHLAEIFRSTHLLPDHHAFPDACPPIHDPILGTIVHPGDHGHYTATVDRDGMTLAVSFDSAGADRVTELRPHAGRLVTGLAGLHDRARDLIWAHGADGSEPPEVRDHFESVVRPTDVIVFRSGDFEICFEDDGSYFEDGYWMAVCYRADTTPVHAYIDC